VGSRGGQQAAVSQRGAPAEPPWQPIVNVEAAGEATDRRIRHTGTAAPVAAGPHGGGGKEAFVTLVTTSKYLIGAEVLAKSLRAFRASRPLLALVDSSLPVMLAAVGATT
jgi:hypothetical protein